MMAPDIARGTKQAIALIKAFSLELTHYSPESQVMYWLNNYRPAWIRDAIIEAVFQGRYKVISVQHILDIWQRRGQPVCHFTPGFEQVIASHLGSPIHLSPAMVAKPNTQPQRTATKEPQPYAFAPSPLSSSVIVQPATVFETYLTNSSQESTSLSIEAFPVAAADNLVEIYKAGGAKTNTPRREPTKAAVAVDRNFQASSTIAKPHQSLREEPQPIQPFRPVALNNGES